MDKYNISVEALKEIRLCDEETIGIIDSTILINKWMKYESLRQVFSIKEPSTYNKRSQGNK